MSKKWTDAQQDLFGVSGAEDSWARPREPNERLFFALVPDEAALARIKRVADVLQRNNVADRGIWRADKFHLSLTLVEEGGYTVRQLLDWAKAAADGLCSASRPEQFWFFLDRANCSRKGLPLVLKCVQNPSVLMEFHAALYRALYPRRRRVESFRPHLTVCYENGQAAEVAIDPVEWHVDRFMLLRGVAGRPYEVLGQWPLAMPRALADSQ